MSSDGVLNSDRERESERKKERKKERERQRERERERERDRIFSAKNILLYNVAWLHVVQ